MLRVSYLWLVLLGAALTVLVGTAVSLLAAPRDDVDPALLFSWRRRHARHGPRPRHELDLIDAEKS